jgi:hypothetical protein
VKRHRCLPALTLGTHSPGRISDSIDHAVSKHISDDQNKSMLKQSQAPEKVQWAISSINADKPDTDRRLLQHLACPTC